MGDGVGQVKKLKTLMSSTEASIASFCNEQRKLYEALRREEATLVRDIDAMHAKVQEWPKHPMHDVNEVLKAASRPRKAVRPSLRAGAGAGASDAAHEQRTSRLVRLQL